MPPKIPQDFQEPVRHGSKEDMKVEEAGQGDVGSFTHLLLPLRLSGLPAVRPLPISYGTRSQWPPWPHHSAGLLGCAWPYLAAVVWTRMAP